MKLRWHITFVILGVALMHLFMWIGTFHRPNEITVFSAVGFIPFLVGMQVAHWLGEGGHPAVNVPAATAAWGLQCVLFGLMIDAGVVFVRRRFGKRS